MASVIDISGLTLNPKESTEFQKFVIENTFERPEIKALHTVYTGVKMKEQIVLAGQLGLSGVKGGACTRVSSGAKSVLTQKYWEPAGIEDTFVHCQADVNALFKAYFDKIQSYKEKYEITGSDEEVFLSLMFENAINPTIYRAAWFGDTSVAAATASVAGLKVTGNIKFFNYFNGILAQIFAGVTAGSIERVTINENSLNTIAGQLNLSSGYAVQIFEEMWAKADARLKADPDAIFYTSNSMWENYRQYLQSKGENFTIEYTTDGLSKIRWNGKKVVNMNTIIDITSQAYFVNNTTDNAYWLPNLVVLSTPMNLPIATLNENDFNEMEVWYEKKERATYMAYGFSLDAKVVEDYMVVAAY